jgi:hypothetical protein
VQNISLQFQILNFPIQKFKSAILEWQNIGGSHNINGTQAIFHKSRIFWEWCSILTTDLLNNLILRVLINTSVILMQVKWGTVIVKEKNSSLYQYILRKSNNNNSNGEVLINVNCQLDGVVYGVNLRAQGLQFTLN